MSIFYVDLFYIVLSILSNFGSREQALIGEECRTGRDFQCRGVGKNSARESFESSPSLNWGSFANF